MDSTGMEFCCVYEWCREWDLTQVPQIRMSDLGLTRVYVDGPPKVGTTF